MITPHAFHLVAAGTGAPLTSAPSREQAAALLKPDGKDRVCLHDQSPQQACLLTFAKTKTQWRLVGMKAMGLRIELADAS